MIHETNHKAAKYSWTFPIASSSSYHSATMVAGSISTAAADGSDMVLAGLCVTE